MRQARVAEKMLESKPPEGTRKVVRPRLRWLEYIENNLRELKRDRGKSQIMEEHGHLS
jgi:hypothetical protein